MDGNPAERLADDLARRVPIIYGGGGLGGLAATRWKTELNENSRSPALANTNPELGHNEIAGWGQNGDLTRQVFALINLRHDFEHPQVMRRFDLMEPWLDEVVGDIFTVRAEGEGPLAQLLDLCLFGTFTSLHLAAREGIDPGPVPVLDELKAALADLSQDGRRPRAPAAWPWPAVGGGLRREAGEAGDEPGATAGRSPCACVLSRTPSTTAAARSAAAIGRPAALVRWRRDVHARCGGLGCRAAGSRPGRGRRP